MSQQKVSEKVQETFFNKLLSIPSNNECADCKNKSPSWVSLEFGVFLCIRCSGVHRQLGPHITRVRSTRLDGWVQENMDIMGNVGNKIANTYYENKFTNNRRPGPNSSMEECREFVDKKYMKKLWAPRDNQEPVKEYLKSLKTGEQPNFNYSPTKDQREGEGDNIKAVRKRSLSLDKLQKEQQHQDLLTDDLLGGGPTGGSGSQNDFGDFNQAHAHSASPRNHHQEAKQDGGWNWDLANNNTSNNQTNTTNSSNLNNLYNNNAGQNGQQQQQQQKTVDLKSLYGQPGGMGGGMSGMGGMGQNNFSMGTQGGWGQGQNQGAWGNQGMQGMQGGFQQGGFNMGGNMGGNMNQMGGFNNNFGGQQNMMNQQQMRYGMGGMGNMGGMQGMGGMQHNMGFQQGQMNNQFGGNNQFQAGFGNNQFQKQQQNNAGFGWK